MSGKSHPAAAVITDLRGPNRFEGRYREHVISIWRCGSRARNGCRCWYIQVTGPDGYYCYDGCWRDSSNRSLDDAIAEALAGACIIDKRTKLYRKMLAAKRTCQ